MVRIRLLTLFFAALGAAYPAFADEAVNVRASAKDDYTRIVFEWPKAPSYVTDKSSSSLTLKFQSAATFKVEGQSPTGLPRVTSYTTPDSKTAVIGFASGQDVRHFEIGNRVIVDIRGPANAKAAPEAAKKPEAQVEAKKEAAPNKKIDLKFEDGYIAPEAATAVPVMKVEKIVPEPKAEKKSAPDQAGISIQITSTEIIGLSVFKRFGNLWVVIDVPEYPLAPQISGEGSKKFGTFERIPLKEATAFRLALPDDRPFHVEGGGLVWKILSDSIPPSALATEFKTITDKTASVLWPVKSARRVIELNDPVVGDVLQVATVDTAKFYAGDIHEYAEFQTLQSFAGLAIESKIDDLDVKKTVDGVLIGSKKGLSLSPESDTAFLQHAPVPEKATEGEKAAHPEAHQESRGASNQLFKFNDWKMGDAAKVEENRRLLMSGLATKDDQTRAQDLMKLAKMELANGRGPESGGYLDLAGQFVPDLLTTPEYLGLRGAAAALGGSNEQALKDFTSDGLKAFPEVPLWRAYTLAGLEDWKQAANVLPADFEALKAYPDPVRIPLALTLTEVALRDGNLPKADELMELSEAKDLILPYKSALDYMKGEAARQRGQIDTAERYWKELKDGKDDLYRAKAGLALTTLQIDKKQIKPQEAIDRLEGLRYAWRGDELETSVNYKLGQMYVQNNDPLKGLAILRQAAALSPESDQSKKITAEMAATFTKMFEPNKIKDINPVDAISLYNEFGSTLSPQGPQGDRIVRQLADRLIDADLLPRAAKLLQTQIDGGKVQGVEGANTALRLASVYNQDGHPDKALAALEKARAFLGTDSNEPGLIREIAVLKAEALSEQKKPEEAFATLAGLEQTEEVLRMRADIAWSNKRWQDAADALEALVQHMQISATRPASDEEAGILLNWAVALYLADNRYVLANVREKYSTAMAAHPKAQQFEVVTRPRQSTLLADRDTINSIIEETDIFKGFVNSSKAANSASSAQAKPQAPAQNVAPVAPAQPPAPPTEN